MYSRLAEAAGLHGAKTTDGEADDDEVPPLVYTPQASGRCTASIPERICS